MTQFGFVTPQSCSCGNCELHCWTASTVRLFNLLDRPKRLRLAAVKVRHMPSRYVGSVFIPLALLCLTQPRLRAAGVTLITHGFSGNVTDWIIPMAQKIPAYYRFPGTNFSCYEIYFIQDGQGNYVPTQSRIGGVLPTNAESGEIIVKLDWSQLAGSVFGGAPYSTTDVAPAFASALLSTNFIPELGGRALVELPLHLIGHSRGGSMMCEITRLLGAQGVWVDHLTTLDPHPLNNDGFDDRPITFTVDGPARVYANVLFADNYYQQNSSIFGIDPSGEPLTGAYNRYLSNLSGGYSQSHSDVHLWYHGTIDLVTPATDTQANITATERQLWWTTYESGGVDAGFYWSLIGHGNRLSNDEPAGAGTGQVRDGYNKDWDFGAGLASNRQPLLANNGTWPNLIQFNLLTTNTFTVGATNRMNFYYQYGPDANTTAKVQVFLDNDLDPINGDVGEVYQQTVPGTGTNAVNVITFQWASNPTSVVPGTYAIYARISAGGKGRYLYAPETLTLTPSLMPPLLTSPVNYSGQVQFAVNGFTGQKVIVQASTNLAAWDSIGTNTLAGRTGSFVDVQAANYARRFYRAVLAP